MLLDYKLKELCVAPEQIRGYTRQEYSYLAVVVALRGESADADLGILRLTR